MGIDYRVDRSFSKRYGSTSFLAQNPSVSTMHSPTTQVRVSEGSESPNFYQRNGEYLDAQGMHPESASKELFTQYPAVIEAAFADSSMRHTVPTVMGAAYNFAKKNFGRVTYDSSLSRHSAPIVQRAAVAGYLEDNPNNPHAMVTNKIGDSNDAGAFYNTHPIQGERMGAQELAEARSTVRKFLGKEKRPHMSSPQFVGVQPALFDEHPPTGTYHVSEAALGGTALGTFAGKESMGKMLFTEGDGGEP